MKNDRKLMNNLLDYFPKEFTPRKSQIKILENLDNILKKDTKFIIIQAPVGSGKSHIAATIANYSNDVPNEYKKFINTYHKSLNNNFSKYIDTIESFGCTILTVSKYLQNQYKDIFPNCSVLKGKSNYICDIDPSYSCDFSLCSMRVKSFCFNTCPYEKAFIETLTNKFKVLNYDVYSNLPHHLKLNSEFLICDEASQLEDEMVKTFSFTFKYSDLSNLIQKLNNSNNVNGWLNTLHDTIKKQIIKLNEEIVKLTNKKSKNKRMLLHNINRYKKMLFLNSKLSSIINIYESSEFVIEETDESITFTPLKIDTLTNNIFNSKKVILMSATIIDTKTFASTLGINDYEYIEIDSDFDPKLSPIYCYDKIKLNYKNLKTELPKLTYLTQELCNNHKNEKGIIHTFNFTITNHLKENLKDGRFTFRDINIKNDDLLDIHYDKPNSVIISPSLGLGTNLNDDEGRFQIILKTPFLPLKDKRIEKLKEKNQKWYIMKTLIHLIQMCGRTTRNINDHSITYILDGCAHDLFLKYWHILPNWFKNRIL